MYDFDKVKKEIERTYSCEVAAILPQSDDLIELGSRDVLYLVHREHPFSRGIEKIANRIAFV